MKLIDRVLQRWRIAKAASFIPRGARVLDLACADGALFRQLDAQVGDGLGIDPVLKHNTQVGRFPLIAGWFPQDMPAAAPRFDVITMLAVLEHIPETEWDKVARACADWLKPDGQLIITVPSPLVDRILNVLLFCKLIEGMSLEQHHGFDVSQTPGIFARGGLQPVQKRKFQLGLNNLFVFKKPKSSNAI
ncbi:MAG TPA: class I SAM-dependent methyltransferase [Methylomirabilota bacterium]|nr:class I SAM-dependent methyltransferase [Methylomirabilota bacterium]